MDLLEEGVVELDGHGRAEMSMEGYGYRWLRLMPQESRRLA